MTREEAKRRIECCRNFLANNYPDMGEPNFTAFNMAIEALKQTDKIEESNFSSEQYKADLQDAYDCGYNCGYAEAMNDIAESEDQE